jgi:hypothetical protein
LPAFQKCYEISLLQTPFPVSAEKAVSEKSFLPVSARKRNLRKQSVAKT